MKPRLSQIRPEGTAGQYPRINSTGDGWDYDLPGGGGTVAGAIAAQTAPVDRTALWLPADAGSITISSAAADRSIMLSADQTWEAACVQEPNIWYDAAGAEWRMFYTGGFSTEAIGYATAVHASGPWTKHAANPVLGQGTLVTGNAAQPNVYIEGRTGYLYFTNKTSDNSLHIATFDTTDPTSLTVQVATVLDPAGTALSIANSYVVKDGTTYRMLFDAHVSTADWWETGYATASSPLGPFTIDTFPVSGLSLGGAYGGAWFAKKDDGTWVLLYHAATSSTLPTDIYRATSTDLRTWTRESGIFVGRVAAVEVDQTADPFYGSDGRGGYLVWSAMDNPTQTGHIMYGPALLAGAPQWWDGSAWRLLSTAQTGELLMQDGVTAPPVPVETEARDDWLYEG